MPSAPTLNRPPRAQPNDQQGLTFGSSGFAQPPSPRQTPTGGETISNAAISSATRNNPLVTGARAADYGSGGAAPAPSTPAAPPRDVNTVAGGPPHDVNQLATGTVAPPGTGPPDINELAGKVGAPGGPAAGRGAAAPTFNIPLLPADEAAKAKAWMDWATTSAGARLGIQGAAMQYGDPQLMAQYGVPGVNPNSALALAALRAQQQQEAATNVRGRAGTLFSSLALEDQNKIGATHQRADLAGFQRYQQALARFNQAMVAAQAAREGTIAAANAEERQTAINNLPTAAQAGGGFQGGTTHITSKVTSPTSPATGNAPKLGKGSVPKGPKAGKGSKSSVTSNKPGKAAKAPKVGGRR